MSSHSSKSEISSHSIDSSSSRKARKHNPFRGLSACLNQINYPRKFSQKFLKRNNKKTTPNNVQSEVLETSINSPSQCNNAKRVNFQNEKPSPRNNTNRNYLRNSAFPRTLPQEEKQFRSEQCSSFPPIKSTYRKLSYGEDEIFPEFDSEPRTETNINNKTTSVINPELIHQQVSNNEEFSIMI